MKRIVVLALAVALPLLMMGCADEALTPAPDESALTGSSGDAAEMAYKQYEPLSLLLNPGRCDEGSTAAGCAGKSSRISNPGGLASPLFGLATAPNGVILVADAGDGIATVAPVRNENVLLPLPGGHVLIPLPGVTGVSPVKQSLMWASRGGNGDNEHDTGQAVFLVERSQPSLVVNLFAFEAANNPDGHDVPDSNPFDVAALGAHATLVADAGGNDLLRVDREGNVDVLAVFPDELVSTANLQGLLGCPEPIIPPLGFICATPVMPAQPVPTSVAIGPDGYYYVGELKGFPGPTGESNIWRVSPDASWAQCGSSPDCVKVFDGGFTSIIDLAFDEAGLLHVLELDESSWASIEIFQQVTGGTINACDLNTLTCDGVASGLPIPTAMTFGKHGSLWVTQNALIPGLAEVVELN